MSTDLVKMQPEDGELSVQVGGQPWEQQPGEEDWHYSRFLFFLGIGPGRKPRDAAIKWNAAYPSDTRSVENWSRLAKQNNWFSRAHAYDVYSFVQHGAELARRAVAQHLAIITTLQERTLQAMAQDAIVPKTFDEVMEFLRLYSTLVPPEAIASVIDNARNESPDSERDPRS